MRLVPAHRHCPVNRLEDTPVNRLEDSPVNRPGDGTVRSW